MTSAAAPHVAGVAALMYSRHNALAGAANNLAPEDIENILQSTATDISGPQLIGNITVNHPVGPNGDEYNGHGRINATAALQAIDWPQRRVFHSGTPQSTTMSTVGTNVTVNFPNGVLGWPGGSYRCDRVLVTHTYQNTFPTGSQILGKWPRMSSSLGCSDANTNGGYNHFVDATFTVNQNTVSVTASTYVYLVKFRLNSSGQIMSPAILNFYPCSLAQTKTAYSVHVFDPSATMASSVERNDDLAIFPNPTTGDFTVQYLGETLKNPVLEVYDISGKTVYRHALTGDHNRLNIQLNTTGWSTSMYFIKLSALNRPTLTRKISKQ